MPDAGQRARRQGQGLLLQSPKIECLPVRPQQDGPLERRTEVLPGETFPWYIAQLKPNREAVAKRNLLRQGFQIFAPFEEVTVRRAQKLVKACRALFPGYLFVRGDQGAVSWRTLNGTLGVGRLVSFSPGRPAEVPPGLVADLMLRCDPAGKLLPPNLLRSGDVVKVIDGPFSEFLGMVERVAPGQRIWVLLDILGKNTRVALRSADLQMAG